MDGWRKSCASPIPSARASGSSTRARRRRCSTAQWLVSVLQRQAALANLVFLSPDVGPDRFRDVPGGLQHQKHGLRSYPRMISGKEER